MDFERIDQSKQRSDIESILVHWVEWHGYDDPAPAYAAHNAAIDQLLETGRQAFGKEWEEGMRETLRDAEELRKAHLARYSYRYR